MLVDSVREKKQENETGLAGRALGEAEAEPALK